jgi:DNA modification methylase
MDNGQMAMRKLNQKDIDILAKLAPEMRPPVHYRSILPPVSMHYATDEEDFQDRLDRLSSDDLQYLANRILDGSECLLCVSPELARVFVDTLQEKVLGEAADRIRELYKSSTGYEA